MRLGDQLDLERRIRRHTELVGSLFFGLHLPIIAAGFYDGMCSARGVQLAVHPTVLGGSVALFSATVGAAVSTHPAPEQSGKVGAGILTAAFCVPWGAAVYGISYGAGYFMNRQ